jgi:hypothetical protein
MQSRGKIIGETSYVQIQHKERMAQQQFLHFDYSGGRCWF